MSYYFYQFLAKTFFFKLISAWTNASVDFDLKKQSLKSIHPSRYLLQKPFSINSHMDKIRIIYAGYLFGIS